MGNILRFRKRRPWQKEGRLSAIQQPEWQARGRNRQRRPFDRVKLLLIAVTVGALGGLGVQAFYDPTIADRLKSTSIYAAVSPAVKPFFDSCQEGYRTRCVSSNKLQGPSTNAPPAVRVIDGDTIDYGGQRIRMVDYDAPEIGEPKCASELALGHKAKIRLVEILNSGLISVDRWGDRDIDQYGRKLRLVTVNGRSVGDTLISEGLAMPWEGHRHHWCG